MPTCYLYDVVVCARCHPPADAALVAAWEGEAGCGACCLTPCGIGAAGSGSEARADAPWCRLSARLCENPVFGACGLCKPLILLGRIFEKLTFHTVSRHVRPYV